MTSSITNLGKLPKATLGPKRYNENKMCKAMKLSQIFQIGKSSPLSLKIYNKSNSDSDDKHEI